MKKFLLMMTAALAVSLTGCDTTVNYKAEGEKMAKELDRLCELKDRIGRSGCRIPLYTGLKLDAYLIA